MAQRWTQILELPPALLEELTAVYKDTFPIEIRNHLSEWIESKPWNEINEDDESHKAYATPLLEELLLNIDKKAILFPWLEEIAHQLKAKYINDSLSLIRDMKTCQNFEEVLIARSQNRPLSHSETDMHSTMDLIGIIKEFETLNNLSMVSSNVLKELQEKYQKFVILLKEPPKVNENLKSTKADIERKIKVIASVNRDDLGPHEIEESREKLMAQEKYITENLQIFIKEILEFETKLAHVLQESHAELFVVFKTVIMVDLPTWKHKQQVSCNGEPLNESCIRSIQKRCECLANLISKILQDTIKFKEIHHEIRKFKEICPQMNDYTNFIQTLQHKLPQLLIQVVNRSFIVDHQPPQVLRKDIKFEATVSILVGKAVNVPTFLPKVTAFIINERQARRIHEGQDIKTIKKCGVLKNNEATVELLQCGTLSAKFKNLAVQNVERQTRQTKKRITEEKFCLVFETQIKIGNFEVEKPLRVLSVPVIINSNVSQECDSLATIMWDHQFSAMDMKPFKVPSSVPWPAMANLLNVKFKAETGRGLSEDNLRYIASKIFGHLDDYSDKIITMAMFCKVNMKGCRFTLWDWLYCLIRLTKDHLQGPWKDGHVAGFVSKSEAEKCLQSASKGTFLCRFSDTKLGGVSIVDRRRQNSASGVLHTEPFTSKDLQISSFPKLIMSKKKWRHLYPDKPKDEVFPKYIDIENADNDSQGISRYEKFIWVIKGLNSSDDDEEWEGETNETACLLALQELIQGTTDSQIMDITEDSEYMIISD